MSFFKLSTGNSATSDGNFDSGGGDFSPIPKDTNVLAVCEESKIDNYQGEQYVNNKWRVLKPEEYKNRVVFQKIRCWDGDVQKRDRAINMLAAIDANAGGKLAASGQEPTDISLQKAIVGKPMVLKLGIWKGDDKSGNWVIAVSPARKQAEPTPAPSIDESDIPF